MSITGDVKWQYPTTAVPNCKEGGHCLHQGTAINSMWCCKCGEYSHSLAVLINFYEYSLWERIYEPKAFRKVKE